ncbi:uncharacterized protein LOC129770932 isoform X1 [Toxorhynchites rutilus septentrionalis]|uniref:uncharacterized protein LOC129770932 isoform X1 n=1 Tax=Toxorhynchites rutilus septentrionalis TaxID=329112 RepID=UPI0024794CE1|nr:uncharacterized protein LOC129770932 isoform X1 [Toxorhynchites rutilus septentrionalis]
MNKLAFSISLLLVLSSMHVPPIRATVIRLFTELLQNNVAGIPLIHKTEEFDFDPEVSKKRRELYYEKHGYRGEKAIERLGLGIDGKHKERLEEQRKRDEGHLNGLNYLQP